MTASEIKNRTVYMMCRTDKPEDDGVDIYIGSTSQPLRQRLYEHRFKARKFIEYGCSENNKLYTRMVTCGVMNWRMVPLLTFACDKKTIFEFERDWIQILKADLNTISPVTNNKYIADWQKKNIQTKRYYCDVCDIACRSSSNLKKHLGTLKHSYAWLNSLD